MKLYYFRDPIGNFGDDLNLALWDHFLPGLLDQDPSTLAGRFRGPPPPRRRWPRHWRACSASSRS
jgi:hypothetical protein